MHDIFCSCTASGRTILRGGSDKEDIICGDQKKEATTIQSPASTSRISVTTHKNSTLLTALTTPRPKNTLSIPPIDSGEQPTGITEPTNWGKKRVLPASRYYYVSVNFLFFSGNIGVLKPQCFAEVCWGR